MATKVKWNGVWQEISLSGRVGTSAFSLSSANWVEDASQSIFTQSVTIPGMLPTYSAIILFNCGQNGAIITAKCGTGSLQFECATKPLINMEGNIIFAYTGESVSIYYIGGLTDTAVDQVAEKVLEQLPISVGEDGYTNFEGARQLTNAKFTKNGKNITIDYTLQGGVIATDTILLNENDYPISGNSNGIAWEMQWEGDW